MAGTQQSTKPQPTPRQSRSWYFRFALYGAVLLAALFWLRHEQAKREREEQAEIEAAAKRKAANLEIRRQETAIALMKKAAAAEDQNEKIRIFDEIIASYKDEKAVPYQASVAWALYWKGRTVTDPAEKARLYDEVIDKYMQVGDEKVQEYVRWAIDGRLKLADGDDAKAAFRDSLLSKYGDRMPGPLAARLLDKRAYAARGNAAKIADYDAILARLPSFPEDSSLELVMGAALSKADLIDDEAERLRLCDMVIDAYLAKPSRLQYYQFRDAADLKAKLVGDPSLPLRLYDQVIANNSDETSVVQARSMRIDKMRDKAERIAAYDETVEKHGASKSDFVQLMVCRAMAGKADLLADPEAQKELYRAVVERCAKVQDSRAKGLADATVEKLAKLGGGDMTPAIRRYDDTIAKAESAEDVIGALLKKADLVDDRAEKIRLFDEAIAAGKGSRDQIVVRFAASAMTGKANLIDDKEEKIRLYDGIIDSGKGIRDMFLPMMVADAMLAKAKLIDDKEEKARLYDEILFGTDETRKNAHVSEALRERVSLTADQAEKLRIYDRYLAGDVKPDDRIRILLDNVKLMADPAAKLRLYDEIITLCRRELDKAGKGGQSPGGMEDIQAFFTQEKLGEAILGKDDPIENRDEKLKLYDEFLDLPTQKSFGGLNRHAEEILSRKAALVGDPDLRSRYYDERIQAAATDGERVAWYARKALSAGREERAAIRDEMIGKFLESTDEDVEARISQALLQKLWSAIDPADKDRICDTLLDRYRDSDNRRVQLPVVSALSFKASQAPNDAEKIKLYDVLIERYKGVRDPMVKRVVDEAIAARFRLGGE